MIIVDGHLDLAFNALRHGRDLLQPLAELRQFEEKTGAESRKLNGTAIVTLPALQEAGVKIVFGSLFVPPISRAVSEHPGRFFYRNKEEAFRLAMEQMDYYHRLADDLPYLRLVTDHSALNKVLDSPQLLGIVPMMEGADSVREPSEVEMWYERGLRMIALAWDDTGYSAGAWRGVGGLTEDGRHLLELMADLGFILDLSHMSEPATYEALDSYDGRIVASHSNVRRLVPAQRQLSDRQIYRIAERDGVIGIVLYNKFLKADHKRGDPKEAVTIDHVIAHIDHICQCVGSSLHAGLGSDFDGGFGLEDVPAEIDEVCDLKLISNALAEHGYETNDVENIMGGNWLRVLNETLPV
ncbi:MAG: membrane dipeptidase [Anaerolineae bacterium]|nr:MAG: membrane dipeptidase [Anaerolineae bacterium]